MVGALPFASRRHGSQPTKSMPLAMGNGVFSSGKRPTKGKNGGTRRTLTVSGGRLARL